MESMKKKIVVAGAGYAGVLTAKKIAKRVKKAETFGSSRDYHH